MGVAPLMVTKTLFDRGLAPRAPRGAVEESAEGVGSHLKAAKISEFNL